LPQLISRAVRALLHPLGLDVVRRHRSPSATLVGLRAHGIHTLIDVGANVGDFSRLALRKLPLERIVCFEPLAEPFSKLDAWASRQHPGLVSCFQVALGEEDGRFAMFRHVDFAPSSSLLASTAANVELYPFTARQEQVSVPVRRLDDVLAEVDLPLVEPILVKMDVQGFEDRVLRGGRQTFSRATACILEVILDPLYEGQADFLALANELHALGLRYAGNLDQAYAPDGHVVYCDPVFVRRGLPNA